MRVTWGVQVGRYRIRSRGCAAIYIYRYNTNIMFYCQVVLIYGYSMQNKLTHFRAFNWAAGRVRPTPPDESHIHWIIASGRPLPLPVVNFRQGGQTLPAAQLKTWNWANWNRVGKLYTLWFTKLATLVLDCGQSNFRIWILYH